MLDKKIILIDPKEIRDAFEKANIRKKDMKNPVFETEILLDVANKGKVAILENDRNVKKHNVLLHTPSLDGNRKVLAYDESIQKFNMLQGTVAFTSHSLIESEEEDYGYSCQLTTYFLTRAKKYKEIKKALVSDKPEDEFKKRYLSDRYHFLLSHVPENSVLFIDGPLIGLQRSSWNIKLVKALMEKDVIPVFYVKNSYSRMLIDNLCGDFKKEYNSDLDFVNKLLSVGQRTSLVSYQDEDVSNNKKVFGYIKCYDGVPQRFELYPDTYFKYSDQIEEIMSMLYYYSLLHGDIDNPQIRPIAIAERYARESLNFFPPYQLVQTIGLEETMNAKRGFT